MLTTGEITSMRATVTSSLIDTVTISRPGTAVDTEGNPTRVLALVATETAWIMHADRNGTDPADVAGQAGQRLDPVVVLDQASVARIDDIISGPDGRRYRVTGIADDRLYRRAEVRTVEA